jgi:hypothetical protein
VNDSVHVLTPDGIVLRVADFYDLNGPGFMVTGIGPGYVGQAVPTYDEYGREGTLIYCPAAATFPEEKGDKASSTTA